MSRHTQTILKTVANMNQTNIINYLYFVTMDDGERRAYTYSFVATNGPLKLIINDIRPDSILCTEEHRNIAKVWAFRHL